MSESCIFCKKTFSQQNQRFLVEGRGKLNVVCELESLPFHVERTSRYICRTCINQLQKRRNLLSQVAGIEGTFSALLSDTSVPSTSSVKRNLVDSDGCSPRSKKSRENIVKSSTPVKESRQNAETITTTPFCSLPTPFSSSVNWPLSPITQRKELGVFVKVKWPSKDAERKLPPDLESMGKMLVRGTYKQIAHAAWKHTVIKKELQLLMMKDIDKECSGLCSKKNPSCLRSPSKENLLNFNIEKLNQELKTRIPLMYSVIMAASISTKSRSKKNQDTESDTFWSPAIGMAIAVCLRNRSKYMNALQLMITIFTYHSSWMRTNTRLQTLRLTTSHTYLYKKLDEYGKDFNKHIVTAVKKQCDFMSAHASKPQCDVDRANIPTCPDQLCDDGRDLMSAHASKPQCDVDRANIPTCPDQLCDDGRDFMSAHASKPQCDVDRANIPTCPDQLCDDGRDLMSAHASKPQCDVDRANIPTCPDQLCDDGRKLTADNFDYYQNVHYMTEEHQNIDKHYVTLMSTENRVSGNNLDTKVPLEGILDMENGKCIPNEEDHKQQRKNFITLIERVITANIPCLNAFADVSTPHIPHQYSSEMSKKSDTTFLGMIYENENDADGILAVLRNIHQYVPFTGEEEERQYGEQGIVGDQLTVERAVNGHVSLANGFTPEERLEGLHAEVADWHSGNRFLEVAFSNLYSASSATDKCTLYSDRNLINRRNVKSDVTAAVNPCRRFFILEVEARVVAATLKVLGMENLGSEPTEYLYTDDTNSKASKKKYISRLATTVVDQFVIDERKNERLRDHIAQVEVMEQEKAFGTNARGRYPCRFPGCTKDYANNGKRRTDHEATHIPPLIIEEPPGNYVLNTDPPEEEKDDMLSYQNALLEYGMLLLNFWDAISEGDGERIHRCWKFFLLYLRKEEQAATKYSLEALYLMCQVYALLSPQAAHRLIWNRSVKNKTGKGGNIPLDLQLEFYNKILKAAVKNLGPNASPASFDRICHAMGVTKDLMGNFDYESKVFKRSGEHIKTSVKRDRDKVVNELLQQKAFYLHPGRSYTYYSNIKPSFLHGFDLQRLYKWINNHKKNIILNRRAR